MAEYLQQRIYGPASGILVILGLVFGALGAVASYLSLGPAVPWWFLAVSAFYPIALTIWVIYREFDLARRRRYAPALAELKACFREHQELCCYIHQMEQKKSYATQDVAMLSAHFSQKMQEILSAFARCFSIITGIPCRTCIKIVPSEDIRKGDISLEEIVVLTMARDKNSQEQNLSTDADRYAKRGDKIVANSDFQILYSPTIPDHGYYICNNIPKMFRTGKYKNSSIAYRRGALAGADLYDEDSYALPYRSTITWPIRYQVGVGEQSTFIGFLSVDAPARYVFDRRWDAPLGSALASALFEPIFRYSEIVQNATGAKAGT